MDDLSKNHSAAIYTGGTVFTDSSEDIGAQSAETVWQPSESSPGGTERFSADLSSRIGPGTMIGAYYVESILSDYGRESIIYLGRKSGQKIVIKLYLRPLAVSRAQMETLKALDCPYVVSLLDYGEFEGYHYEVFPYYKNGSIEKIGVIDTKRLTEYVNQLNEGLHALHTLGGWNIVHGDLKPANIFLSDDGERLLIGDFGISAELNGNNYALGAACGTPEFMPLTAGIVNQSLRTPAFDYGSLGLVIYFLATGRSYFQGMSAEAIADSWMRGISIPAELDTRIKLLLEGLLIAEERRRYGYEEIRNWYSGSFVQVSPVRPVYAPKKSKIRPTLWFGIFDDRSIDVTSVEELVVQMKAHWKQAITKLSDNNLYRFLDDITGNEAASTYIRTLVAENDPDSAVFKTIYYLSKDTKIVYKDKSFRDAAEFVAAASAEDADEDTKKLLLSGLFRYYLEQLGYPEEMRSRIDMILDLKDVPGSFKTRVFRYIFTENKSYCDCSNIDQLRSYLADRGLEETERVSNDENFYAWLYAQGLCDLAITLIHSEEKL